MPRFITAVAALLAVVFLQSLHAQLALPAWSPPENLGADVNTSYDDMMGALSKDRLTLYFTSTRPDGFGGEDLWVSHRGSRDEPFGPPTNLWMLNTPQADRTPTLSRDGHWLFFASNRPGGRGGLDLLVSYRRHTHVDLGWEEPMSLGPVINSATGDTGPTYLAGDGFSPARLYFARGSSPLEVDIYVSEQAPDGTWLTAVPVAEINSPYGDANPDLRFDGLVIIFHSSRPGSEGAFDNWAATRSTPDEPFSSPVRLGEPLNSPYSDRDGAFSPRGDEIVISSDRPGGFGLLDLYVSRYVKHGG